MRDTEKLAIVDVPPVHVSLSFRWTIVGQSLDRGVERDPRASTFVLPKRPLEALGRHQERDSNRVSNMGSKVFRFEPVGPADSSSSCIIVIGGAICLAYGRCKTGYTMGYGRALLRVQAVAISFFSPQSLILATLSSWGLRASGITGQTTHALGVQPK